MLPVHLQSLPSTCSHAPSLRLLISLKPVTSILVGDNVTNSSFLLDQHAYACTFSFYLSNMCFPTDFHLLRHMFYMCPPHVLHVSTSCFPCIYLAFYMCLTHVYLMQFTYLN